MTTPFDFWCAYWSAFASAWSAFDSATTTDPPATPASTRDDSRTGVVVDYRAYRTTLNKWAKHG